MKNKQFCPVCNGAGRVVDAKTKKPRDCVLCGGKVERQILEKIPYAPTYEYSEDKFGVTVEQVAKIKYWLSFGITEQHLSNLYSVPLTMVHSIQDGRIFREVTPKQ